MSILREVMAANHILDLEMVRVIPNHSVFSQRLKALHFLASLLERARSSCPFFADPALETAQGHNSAEPLGETLNACGVSAGGRYVKLIRYSLITSLEEARSVYLKKYLSDGYEGAVIRSAANVYEVREKKKGVLQGLLNPLLPSSRTSSTVWHEPCGPRWDTPRDTDDERTLRGHAKNGCIFTCDPTRPPTPERGRGKRETDEEIDHREIVMKVFKRAKRNSSRSVTVTKLLPSADKEYAILKPLLKVSTNNAWSRNLLRVPLVSIRGCLDALVVPRASRRAGSCKKCDDEADSTVVFYGLQCLSDTGRVFNVALPKMDSERQQALLGHLLEATGCRRGGGVVVSGRMGRRSLTGLYATVKYPSLTEHGVPRFGQVKAIRGRRGWFL
ncbi:unnamed protein product [Trypanosoma congolense IL3000]|uniref:WGS project CAEQ00000000 data, annotated contig 2070 n=1 Tax=Trypanosoma congolense (strain IL3000) TaxID=1068625 RepID=F9WB70_TRYCI|nr:unnamed protein product [Trypanosoma congolense IL3000]